MYSVTLIEIVVNIYGQRVEYPVGDSKWLFDREESAYLFADMAATKLKLGEMVEPGYWERTPITGKKSGARMIISHLDGCVDWEDIPDIIDDIDTRYS